MKDIPSILAALSIFIFSMLFYGNALSDPPQPFDAADYENIAWNLYRHRLFAHAPSDPEWRAPYIIYDHVDIEDKFTDSSGQLSKTAFRAPLLPFLISATYQLFGRNFMAWKVVNCLLLACGLGMLCGAAARQGGKIAYAISLSLILLDYQMLWYGFEFLTEALGVGLISCLIITLHRSSKNGPVLIGTLLAILTLLRSSYLVWSAVVLFGRLAMDLRLHSARQAVTKLLISIVTLVLICSPWIARNLTILPNNMPFGTQAGTEMAVGYSDGIINRHGLWHASIDRQAYPLTRERKMDLQSEVERSTYGIKTGTLWIKRNWSKLPYLVWIKSRSLWVDQSTGYQKILALLALTGLLALGLTEMSIVALIIVAAGTVTVALSHNVGHGRFLLPIEPALYFLAALGCCQIKRACSLYGNPDKRSKL